MRDAVVAMTDRRGDVQAGEKDDSCGKEGHAVSSLLDLTVEVLPSPLPLSFVIDGIFKIIQIPPLHCGYRSSGNNAAAMYRLPSTLGC